MFYKQNLDSVFHIVLQLVMKQFSVDIHIVVCICKTGRSSWILIFFLNTSGDIAKKIVVHHLAENSVYVEINVTSNGRILV